MARRMFSPKITSTDAFLDMPVSARELYFQLGMNADDDGFITPKRVMRMIGSSEDDLKVLMAKNFVIGFKSGVIVISAWRINNLIRKDWYQETIYKEEKTQLCLGNNGEYNLGNEMLTNSSTQVRLGKDSIGKDIRGEEEKPLPSIDKDKENLSDKTLVSPSSIAKEFFSLPEKQEEIASKLVAKGFNENIVRQEIKKFISYWTEPNKSGSKEKWESETHFEIGRRLTTWFNNADKFGTKGQIKLKEFII